MKSIPLETARVKTGWFTSQLVELLPEQHELHLNFVNGDVFITDWDGAEGHFGGMNPSRMVNALIDSSGCEERSPVVVPTALNIQFDYKTNVFTPTDSPLHSEVVHSWALKGFNDQLDNKYNLFEVISPERRKKWVDEFWSLWSTWKTQVKVITLTGGEPFLQEEFFRFLSAVEKSRCPQLELRLKTTGHVAPELFKETLTRLESLVERKKLKGVQVEWDFGTASPEELQCFTPQINDQWCFTNLKYLLESADHIQVQVNYVLNAFSFQSLAQSLKWFLQPSIFPVIQEKSNIKIRSHCSNYPKFFGFQVFEPAPLRAIIDRELESISEEQKKSIGLIAPGLISDIEKIPDWNAKDRKNTGLTVYLARLITDFYIASNMKDLENTKKIKDVFTTLKTVRDNAETCLFDHRLISQEKRIANVKGLLDSVSPSFCLAKWLHVTLHLHSGQSHSCHHPPPHSIPRESLKSNPSVLHNTPKKIQQREAMLKGERPDECHYCWRVEDLDQYSDRMQKSAEEWSAPFFEDVDRADASTGINPRYLEVSFSSNCNMKCSYCHPFVSRKILEEYKKFGPYPTELFDLMEVEDCKDIMDLTDDNNPYVDAFWEWFPDVYPGLKVFRITGGEPFLSKHTFRLLDDIIDQPNPEMELSINTNLNLSDAVMDRAIEKVKYIADNKLVKDVVIWASIDSHGDQVEYARYGLNFTRFQKNVQRFLDLGNVRMQFMVTMNALSVPKFKDLLKYNLSLRKEKRYYPSISISYLHEPAYQSVMVLPESYRSYVDECLQFMRSNDDVFGDWEIAGLQRVWEIMGNSDHIKTRRHRIDFYKFFKEHDRRRDSDFPTTFPEFNEFWKQCKREFEDSKENPQFPSYEVTEV